MSLHLTNKGCIYNYDNRSIRDPSGKESCLSSLGASGLSDLNQSPCFNLKSDLDRSIGFDFDNSILLDININFTFQDWIDRAVCKFREIEYIFAQVLNGTTFTKEHIEFWDLANRIDVKIRDGHFDNRDYSEQLKLFRNYDKTLTDTFLAHFEITRLVEVIRFELCHSEERIFNVISSLIKMFQQFSSKQKVEKGHDYVSYSLQSDIASWSITDAVKAISTALDALSKLIFSIGEYQTKSKFKVQAKHASDLKYLDFDGHFVPENLKRNLRYEFGKLQRLINLRHELTHNQTLYPIRQPAFFGNGTKAVNDKDVYYVDLMWWDESGESFTRAHGRVGFYSQRLNAVEKIIEYLKYSYKLVETSIKYLKFICLSKAKELNIGEFMILDEANPTAYKFRFAKTEELLILD